VSDDVADALAQSDDAIRDWLALTEPLTNVQANWRPAPEKWSVAQCMDHVNNATGLLLPRLNHAIEHARRKGITSSGPFHYGFLGRHFLKSLAPVGAKPLNAPKKFVPSESSLDIATVRGSFAAIHKGFRDAVVASAGIDLARVRVTSPALFILRLQLGIWLLATASHVERHLHQAERVRSDERFPK
jgi:hypothetical protein